jgi:DNA-binding NtrC family response regulator
VFPRTEEPVWSPTDEPIDLLIGRDPECAVQLEGNDVSRRHAVLHFRGPESALELEDLGSRNGVRVNGCRVLSSALACDDVVRLGGWIAVVTAAPGPFSEIAPGLWGGAGLARALAPLGRAAPSDLPIILEGETGTGKEVVARAIHTWSGRTGPLVAVNCAALPEALAESELFGYRRGAFTGAERASPGFFRSAERGTLLLDEVSDLPLALQAKLLRVLEERAVQPLGEARPVPIDVRIVVAGQQSLAGAAAEGRFRPDLLARIDGVTARLPPLRRRREDVPSLFSHFLGTLSQGRSPAVDSDLVERLCLHDWPFNVRELVFLVRRLLTLHGDSATLHADHLPERIGTRGPAAVPASSPARAPTAPALSAGTSPPSDPRASEPVELTALVAALRASGGNVARAAAMLGITRQRAYRLMDGHSVDLEALRKPGDLPR